MASKGRFSRLDFDEPTGPPEDLPEAAKRPNLDEHECLKAGDAHFGVGEYDTALAAYSRALRFNRNLGAAWVGQIRCLICLGEYPEAVTWSDRALERFPKSADLMACKGLALAMIGDVREGAEYLDGALQMRSPSAWIWLARGQCYLLRPETRDGAQRCFLKACEAAPEDWDCEMRVGMAYNTIRAFARARTVLLSALRKPEAGENPLLLYQTGLALEGLGELDGAAGYYERALAARRNYSAAAEGLRRIRQAGPISRFWRRMGRKGG